jgi:hypothetical protein
MPLRNAVDVADILIRAGHEEDVCKTHLGEDDGTTLKRGEKQPIQRLLRGG